MGVLHTINRLVEQFIGLEKRRSDLIDKPGYFSELTNTLIRPSGGLCKRRGWHSVLDIQDTVVGLTSSKGKRYVTGVGYEDYEDMLLIGNNFRRVYTVNPTLKTVATGSSSYSIIVSLLPNADGDMIFTYKVPELDLVESFNCGNGKGTGSVADITVTEFKNTLANAQYPLSVSSFIIPSGNATPLAARYLPFTDTVILSNETMSLKLYLTEAVSKGDSSYNYCSNAIDEYELGSPTFQTAQSVQVNNVTYICTGYDNLIKYDGNKVYRAGLPQPSISSVSTSDSYIYTNPDQTTTTVNLQNPVLGTTPVNVGLDSGTYYYLVVWRHIDAQGNIITSTQSLQKVKTSDTHRHYFELTIPSLVQGQGFDIENTYLDIYRTKAGETDDTVAAASFYKITGDVARNIDVSSSSTALKAYLSQFDNYKISFSVPYLTTGSTTFITSNYHIKSKANNIPIKYLDYLLDSQLDNYDIITLNDYGEGRHDLPPIAKHIAVHQGSLILAGTDTNASEVFHSLPQFNTVTGEIGTEYFPNNSNSVIVEASNGGAITGLKTLKENLYVFHENNVSLLTGDLDVTGGQFIRKDLLSSQGQIGSLAPNAVQEYEGTAIFLSNEGFMAIDNSNPYPMEVSTNIKPLTLDKNINKKLAVSFYIAEEDIIGFYMPVLDTNYTNSVQSDTYNSSVFVYNVRTKGWHKWSNVDMIGGTLKHEGETYFISRNNDKLDLNIFKNKGDESDYSDHTSPIDAEITTAWDSLGDPNVFKKYIRLKVFITDSNERFQGGNFKLDLYLRKDFNDFDRGPIEIDASFLGGYGKSKWGEFPWGNWVIEGLKNKLFGKAKSISLKFKNNEINQNILLSGYSMEVAVTYKPEMKE